MTEIIVTKDNYDEEVLKSDKEVLIDFWASWCGPCRAVSPTISEIANEHPEIKVCKINIDEEEELAMIYSVASIPTIIKVKDKKVLGKLVGIHSKSEILDMFK